MIKKNTPNSGNMSRVMQRAAAIRTARVSKSCITQGETGPMGPQGAAGLPGIPGLQGLQGIQGIPGLQGQNGQQGQNGTNGESFTGPTGWTGRTGEQGIAGENGLTGSTGWTGATGEKGLKGSQGPQGLLGPEGIRGINGDIGFTGPTGPTGPFFNLKYAYLQLLGNAVDVVNYAIEFTTIDQLNNNADPVDNLYYILPYNNLVQVNADSITLHNIGVYMIQLYLEGNVTYVAGKIYVAEAYNRYLTFGEYAAAAGTVNTFGQIKTFLRTTNADSVIQFIATYTSGNPNSSYLIIQQLN